MYKKSFLLGFSFYFGALMFLNSCTSAKKVIRHSHAFYSVMYPGIVSVDENGKEHPSTGQTNYVLYVVSASDKITWDTAWINGNAYTTISQKINDSSTFDVGTNKLTGDKITVETKESEHLYLLQLNPVSPVKSKETPVSAKKLRLRAFYKGKEIILSSNEIIELSTPDPA